MVSRQKYVSLGLALGLFGVGGCLGGETILGTGTQGSAGADVTTMGDDLGTDTELSAETETESTSGPGTGAEAGTGTQSESTGTETSTDTGTGTGTIIDLGVLALLDVNETSASFEQEVHPNAYLGGTSAWYFGHAT